MALPPWLTGKFPSWYPHARAYAGPDGQAAAGTPVDWRPLQYLADVGVEYGSVSGASAGARNGYNALAETAVAEAGTSVEEG